MKSFLLPLALVISVALTSCSKEYSFENPEVLEQKITIIDGGDNDWTQEITYNGNLPTEIRFIDKEDGYRRSVKIEYNSDNLPTKSYRVNDQGSITEETFYTYEGGLLKSTAQFDTVGSFEFETRFEVLATEEGRITEFRFVFFKDQEPEQEEITKITYGKKGLVTEAVVNTTVGTTTGSVTYTFEYDKEENPFQYSYITGPFQPAMFYAPNNVLSVTSNDGSYEETRTYQYNDDGWPTSVDIKETFGNTSITDFEKYTY